MATAKTAPVTVPPLRVEPAYSDRDAVWRTVRDHAPYPMMVAGAGYGEMMQFAPLEPWFRTSWAADGNRVDESIRVLLMIRASSMGPESSSEPRSFGPSHSS